MDFLYFLHFDFLRLKDGGKRLLLRYLLCMLSIILCVKEEEVGVFLFPFVKSWVAEVSLAKDNAFACFCCFNMLDIPVIFCHKLN